MTETYDYGQGIDPASVALVVYYKDGLVMYSFRNDAATEAMGLYGRRDERGIQALAVRIVRGIWKPKRAQS